MRRLLRVLAVFVGLCVVLVVALVVAVPRLIEAGVGDEQLREAARRATGRDVSWQELQIGILPPRFELRGVRVVDPADPEETQLAAARTELRLAWLPLLARELRIESLVLEGVEVRLVRGPDGIALPIERSAEPEPDPGAGGSEREVEGGGDDAAPVAGEVADAADAGGGLSIAVRELRLSDSMLRVRDRTVEPEVVWELGDLEAEVQGAGAALMPLSLTLAGELASGGQLRAAGTLEEDGARSFELDFEEVALQPLQPYLGDEIEVRGRASGSAQLHGAAGEPDTVEAELEIEAGGFRAAELQISGPLALELSLAKLDPPEGNFEMDASGAELVYGSIAKKPAGTEARASGLIRTNPEGGLRIEVQKLKLHNLRGAADLELGAGRKRVALRVPAFDLEGWEALVPALGDYAPGGQLALPNFTVALEPLALRGRAELRALELTLPERGPVRLEGALVAAGDAVRSEELRITTAGQELPVSLVVRELSGARHFALSTALRGVESATVLGALTDLGETLSGPMAFAVDLRGALGGAASLGETLRGTVDLRVEPGQLRGVSLLRDALSGFLGSDALGQWAGALMGALDTGGALQRYYGEDFEFLGGSFTIADGRARSDDLRLVYRGYRLELSGSLGLADKSLDFRGSLALAPEARRALVRAVAGKAAAEAVEGELVLPLAGLGGTLAAPVARLDSGAGRVLAQALLDSRLAREKTKLRTRVLEALGGKDEKEKEEEKAVEGESEGEGVGESEEEIRAEREERDRDDEKEELRRRGVDLLEDLLEGVELGDF